MDLLNSIAPTDPPGFFGVPEGEPTVPNLNDKVMDTPSVQVFWKRLISGI
jgi:hypothetical protein